MKKSLFLVLTLAIPVAIFLFLKMFGSNTYNVPIFFENGIPNCASSSAPHQVPAFEYIGETEKNIKTDRLKDFVVFGVLDVIDKGSDEQKLIELVRIQDAFYEVGAPFFVLFLLGDEGRTAEMKQRCIRAGMDEQNFDIFIAPREELMEFLRCGIALTGKTSNDFDNLVLVDPAKKIRGIYQSFDIEQTDQLILELKILKQKV